MRHIDSVHRGLKPYKCDICDKAYGDRSTLRSHKNNVHLGIKPHKCDICDKAYGDSSTLRSHKKNVHLGIKPHKCDRCCKTFNVGNYRNHLKRKTSCVPRMDINYPWPALND